MGAPPDFDVDQNPTSRAFSGVKGICRQLLFSETARVIATWRIPPSASRRYVAPELTLPAVLISAEIS
jgi:hypothetical protein